MALESIHKQSFIVRNLPTRSVTLFPTRAQITREITNVFLKPGQNRIIVEGLTPTIDEHSIKVEGTGAATITDLSVELVNNKEIYEDIYPDVEEEDDSDESDNEDDKSESDDESIKAVDAEIKKLTADLIDVKEIMNSADARLAMLDRFSKSIEHAPPGDIQKMVKDYRDERTKIYDEHKAASKKSKILEKKISDSQKKKDRLGRAALKAKLKLIREQQKKSEAKQRKKNEVEKEKTRVRAERSKFWPKKVYKVTISLDAPSGATPATSRRNSIDSMVKVALPEEKYVPATDTSLNDINLSISYITYSASWSPRYDLSLNTVTQSGSLDFHAELRNSTCETWRDAKITLSTSQTTYQGLDDTIPTLQPWHVRLAKNNFGNGAALFSQAEQSQKTKNRQDLPSNIQAPRNQLFGLDDSRRGISNFRSSQSMMRKVDAIPPPPAQAGYGGSVGGAFSRNYIPQGVQSSLDPSCNNISRTGNLLAGPGQPPAPSSPLFGSSAVPQRHNQSLFSSQNATAPSGGLFGNTNGRQAGNSPAGNATAAVNSGASPFGHPPSITSTNTGFGLFGSANRLTDAGNTGLPFGSITTHQPQQFASSFAPVQSSRTRRDRCRSFEDEIDLSDEVERGLNLDTESVNTLTPNLLFEESLTSETGLTTTYDLPSAKSLAPSSSSTKHKIAKVEFKSIIFSHILIPKLKASAFLKARLRNGSKITLLRGTAGLTLDGSFLGQSTIPRVSAGESFSLPLGVDPSISVMYSKPTVRRSQSGIFNKEDCEVFTRTAIITNNKLNASVEMLVLDQIPVSEDERLKIEIQTPRGLRTGGESVTAGVAIGGADTEPSSSAGKARMSVYGDDAKQPGKWGSAQALAKKGGEVNWNVKINPMRGCKLVLEYETTYPGGETVIAVN